MPSSSTPHRALSERVNTFGQYLLARYGQRVHKLALNAGFTCPNRDGTKGHGGCTFCNNVSFGPTAKHPPDLDRQLDAGRGVLAKRTGARRFMAYFQTYTNTYDEIEVLRERYESTLRHPDVVGLSVGTRPDCVPEAVLDLLAGYRARGKEVWLELGLQSANDATLARVNRGHGFAEYRVAVTAAHRRGIPICTHLIVGLPGEGHAEALATLDRVLELGVEGLKIHPLHVVRHTRLASDWRRGDYTPLALDDYVAICADLIERTPVSVVYHRLTGTAERAILLAPDWCSRKWAVLNAIEAELFRRGTRQGDRADTLSTHRLVNTA
ncbi:TIGR01212 family radical SAM protein [Thermochromatium tepidum]|uniref:TIGR01212 family radical SAM protein n=1 Tax=Thermochromatium tepidum ATCC 43061 TaxID=316276 RepID=A0A6I6EDA9_THETI|nr:TIGR01212 family radical SAM protein [Thermochromatium tepidum]QGU32080.1 TIGR01212 family radical SAM protein [Thermochromatium tepidum ATCC 43061]